MNQNSADRLDQLLQQWAASRELDEEAHNRLQRRVLKALASPDEIIHVAERDTRRRRARFVVMGLLSSCALLMLAIFPAGNLRNRHIGTGQVLPSSSAARNGLETFPAATRLDDAFVRTKNVLLTEVNDMFENRLDWLAEDSSRMVFDVESQDSESRDSESRDSKSSFMLVRIVVAQRTASQWSPIWKADIVCRNDSLVNVAAEEFGGGAITLWAHAMADGQIFIDSELTMSHGSPFHIVGSRVLQPGVPVRVECLRTGGSELCVFQTVLPLDGLSRAT